MNSLKTILYFSLFDYPITKNEILHFSNSVDLKTVDIELNQLLRDNIIFKIEEYYSKTNDLSLVKRRINGNNLAKKLMPKALKRASLISKFPFVRGVAFSGAFSKGYMDEEGDIDFFIITKENRLWIARTFLILFKKIFLLNSKKYFCVNYFIGENNLEIEEKNKFTAMEIFTLIPTHGKPYFELFFKENLWAKKYFSNISLDNKTNQTKNVKANLISKIIEYTLNKRLGESLERIFYKLTLNKWKYKFSHFPKKEFEVALKSTENISKHHPQNYQKRVIEKLNITYSQINQKYHINLDPEHA